MQAILPGRGPGAGWIGLWARPHGGRRAHTEPDKRLVSAEGLANMDRRPSVTGLLEVARAGPPARRRTRRLGGGAASIRGMVSAFSCEVEPVSP